jgi:hypothetical protein
MKHGFGSFELAKIVGRIRPQSESILSWFGRAEGAAFRTHGAFCKDSDYFDLCASISISISCPGKASPFTSSQVRVGKFFL